MATVKVTDESFEQDRGLGSALGAGAHYADQLDTEVASNLISIYRAAHQEKDLQFYYVPMPRMLRKSGPPLRVKYTIFCHAPLSRKSRATLPRKTPTSRNQLSCPA